LKSIRLKNPVSGLTIAMLIICSKMLQTVELIRCIDDRETTLVIVEELNSDFVEIFILRRLKLVMGSWWCFKLETLHLVKNTWVSKCWTCCWALQDDKKKASYWWMETKRIGDDSVKKNCPNLQDLLLIPKYPTTYHWGWEQLLHVIRIWNC
jgi:hypothetical protein